jgi:hypothetical protein
MATSLTNALVNPPDMDEYYQTPVTDKALVEAAVLSVGTVYLLTKYILPRLSNYSLSGPLTNSSLLIDVMILPLVVLAVSQTLGVILINLVFPMVTILAPHRNEGFEMKTWLENRVNAFDLRELQMTGITSYS